MKTWCDMNYYYTDIIKQDDVIWLNSNMDVILYNRECINKGVHLVRQMFNGGDIMTHAQFCITNNITVNMLEYHKMVCTVKALYRDLSTTSLQKMVCNEEYTNILNTIFNKPNDRLLSKRIYRYMASRKAQCVSVCSKWKESIALQEDTKILFNQIEKISIVNKLRSFQFKFLHRILFFNDKLFKWNLVSTTLCDFCNEALDSVEHRFFYCRVIQEFWENIEIWLKEKFNIECAINNMCLIITNICRLAPLVEKVVLNAKYYIYKCFLKKETPSILYFKAIIQNEERTERYIAEQKNLLISMIDMEQYMILINYVLVILTFDKMNSIHR